MKYGKLSVLLAAAVMGLTSCITLRDAGVPDASAPVSGMMTYETKPETETKSEPEPSPDEPIPEPEPEQKPTPTPEPIPEPIPEPTPEPEPEVWTDPYADVEITFLAAGDNLIHPNIYMDAGFRRTTEKVYDFLPMYENIADAVASADFAFINQETVMAGAGYQNSGYPCFNSPQELGLDMVALGFDLIGMANNHMLDMGTAGLSATMDFWDTQPVTVLGAYRDEADAAEIRYVEKDGVKIGLLAYTCSTNGIVKPASSPLVIPYIDDARITADLAKANAETDFVLVSMHWGNENTQTPSDEQRRLAQLLADNGADIIIGHHSHTVQPVEWITAADGRQILCVYSLGNLVSGMAYPVNMVGGLFSFTVKSDGQGGLTAADPVFDPIVFYYGMDWFNTKVYYLDQYTADIAPSHGVAISGYRLTPEQAGAFVTEVISPEFLRGDG